jgi:hypothetical protein
MYTDMGRIGVSVRIRPFSGKEATQLAPQETFQPFLGDGGLSVAASPSRLVASTSSGTSNAPSLRTKFLRPIITPVDDKVLIFDPPDTNPLSRLYNASQQSTFGHGHKKSKDVRYAFDRVFDDTCGQEMVFENTTKPLLDGILNGYNASVFAYGVSVGAGSVMISVCTNLRSVLLSGDRMWKDAYHQWYTRRSWCYFLDYEGAIQPNRIISRGMSSASPTIVPGNLQ